MLPGYSLFLNCLFSLNFTLLSILNGVIITSTLCDALLPDDGVESYKPTWSSIGGEVQLYLQCVVVLCIWLWDMELH